MSGWRSYTQVIRRLAGRGAWHAHLVSMISDLGGDQFRGCHLQFTRRTTVQRGERSAFKAPRVRSAFRILK